MELIGELVRADAPDCRDRVAGVVRTPGPCFEPIAVERRRQGRLARARFPDEQELKSGCSQTTVMYLSSTQVS
jgi:hypothetical protein